MSEERTSPSLRRIRRLQDGQARQYGRRPGKRPQLALYAWALRIERVAFVTLCKAKTPKVELLTGVIPPEQPIDTKSARPGSSC